jgi:uncharacterized protein (UPF0248 family)
MSQFRGVRDVLNELRWHPDRDPSKARIIYEHRGSAEGFTVVTGDEVEDVGPSSFTVRGGTIPYYKVFRITYEDEVLFERP